MITIYFPADWLALGSSGMKARERSDAWTIERFGLEQEYIDGLSMEQPPEPGWFVHRGTTCGNNRFEGWLLTFPESLIPSWTI